MDRESPASDSLPVPTDPVRTGPDSQNQEAVRSGPGSPEPTEPPSGPQPAGPEPPGSEQTEPGGSGLADCGPEPEPETSSHPALQNPEGSTDPAEEEPGSDPSEVLTAGPEEPGVQNPGEVLPAEEGGSAASSLGRPDLQNRQTPPPSGQVWPRPPGQVWPRPPGQVWPRPPGQVWPRPPGAAGEPRLCGFLEKQAGPLRAWKRRWFRYEPDQNQLFYFRSAQDVAPLGRIHLGGATFTCPPDAEGGTFHVQTPQRTFILRAVSQELMLYWLQQLQVKRWQHRDSSTGPDRTNDLSDDFLPGPVGLVGQAAAVAPAQSSMLASVSIKHPFIQVQNSVHSLRKRTSQSPVFQGEVLPWTGTGPEEGGAPTDDPAGQRSASPSRSWRSKSRVSDPCGDAASSERTSRLQQEKLMLMEEVKAQKVRRCVQNQDQNQNQNQELVWILHKALEASQQEKRSCSEFLAAPDERRRLELLRHGERLAADLRARLDGAKMEAEALRRRLDDRDAQLAELQAEARMLQEKNAAKQQVIMKLTDQVTSCLSDSSGPVQNQNQNQNLKQLQQQMDNLKDDLAAYQTQNRFLNSEIHQLTKLWRKSSEQERSLMVKCAHLEAAHCQVESRYLGVLRSLQEAKALAPEQQEAVRRLIRDALGGEPSVVELSADRVYDAYGFKVVPDYEPEDMKLLAKIQALEIRGHSLLQDSMERPLLARWAQYLSVRSEDDLRPSVELKALLRCGVPQQHRRRVWRWLVRTRTRAVWERHPQRYQQLCEKSQRSPNPASRQIQLDLHRTLTTNQSFSSPSSPALQQLRRVLLAFSWQNPAVGYCQGLNRLAAIALLVLQSEEDAFWLLVALVDAIMPQHYYTKNLLASQADQRVLKDLMAEKLPRLAAHLEGHGVDVSLVTFNWFLVVFVESLQSDILLPLWDAVLYEGSKVIFRYALALFKYKEDDLLKIQDSVEIYQYLRFFTKTVTDSRKLAAIAFCDMNPFPRRLLRIRRATHLERLQGELEELEEQQREFVTESEERKDKELDAASEDDEP